MAITSRTRTAQKSPEKKKTKPKKTFTIDAPPFPSPGKSNVKALKAEKSSKSSQTFFFERVGDGNMHVSGSKNLPEKEATFIQSTSSCKVTPKKVKNGDSIPIASVQLFLVAKTVNLTSQYQLNSCPVSKTENSHIRGDASSDTKTTLFLMINVSSAS